MKVTSNSTSVIHSMLTKFKNMDARINDKLLRTIATSSLAKIKHRIHTDGKKADETEIGTYKNPYLKLREKKYNRDSSTKMIFSLTGNMENQFVAIATTKGWGLGWNDALNPKKAEGLQFGNSKLKGFGIVYQLSQKEKEGIQPIITQFLNDNLK